MNDEPVPEPRGRPVLTDAAAASASSDLPASLARPAGAPQYHGFPLVDESRSDGWVLGMISAYGDAEVHYGDGYVVAPDGSRCGLVWECCGDEAFSVVIEAQPGRWGVYFVSRPMPLHGSGDAQAFLDSLLPRLEPFWRAWKSSN